MIFETVYRVRVVYKSGYTHDFDCLSLTVKEGINKSYEWRPANPTARPILLGAEEIAAIWQLGVRRRPKWSKA